MAQAEPRGALKTREATAALVVMVARAPRVRAEAKAMREARVEAKATPGAMGLMEEVKAPVRVKAAMAMAAAKGEV